MQNLTIYREDNLTIKQFNNFIKMSEKTRYSDSELQEFKELIQKKLDKAKENLAMYQNILTRSEENSTDDTSPTFKVLEEGANVLSREEAARLAQRQLKFIDGLEKAMIRIQNKTYGICRVTNKLISKDRLRSVPHATLSIEAKLAQKR